MRDHNWPSKSRESSAEEKVHRLCFKFNNLHDISERALKATLRKEGRSLTRLTIVIERSLQKLKSIQHPHTGTSTQVDCHCAQVPLVILLLLMPPLYICAENYHFKNVFSILQWLIFMTTL